MSEGHILADSGDYNFFRYCHNDPVDFTDPMGLETNNAGLAPREISHLIAEMREGQKQIAQLKAYVHAQEWHGGAIGIGAANFAVGQLQLAMGGLQMAFAGRDAKARGLTGGETSEARKVFADKIHYSGVGVVKGKYLPWQGSEYAITPNNNIYYPNAPADFIKAGQGDLFIHEMTHVMQFQHGVSVFRQGFLLQAAKFLSFKSYDPYRFSYDPGRRFNSYNIEQQGDMAVDIYHHYQPNNIDYSDLR
jgi:hypothetical protein